MISGLGGKDRLDVILIVIYEVQVLTHERELLLQAPAGFVLAKVRVVHAKDA
jgi:hypothetical protein